MIIIRNDINPQMNLYYVAGLILDFLKSNNRSNIEKIYMHLHLRNNKLSINVIYYSLDWLYLINAIKISEGEFELCE
jgi:hypothetical protein